MSLPDTLTYISTGAFSGCTSLTEVIIPDNVTEIGVSAFDGCSSLTQITLPQGLTTIGKNVFASCKRLSIVNYSGTADEWAAIKVGTGNDILNKIHISF